MNLKRTAWTAGSITLAGALGAGVLVFGATSAFADDDRSDRTGQSDQVVLKREDNAVELITVADDDLDDDPTGDGITNDVNTVNDPTRDGITNDVNTVNDPTRDGITRDNTRDNTRDDVTRDDPTRDGVTRDLTRDLTR